jgi:hypothetical protein
MTDKLLTVEQAAERLGTSVRFVRQAGANALSRKPASRDRSPGT